MREAILDVKYFAKRRDELKKMMSPNEVMVLFSGKAPVRSNDSHYKFRVESNFFYLTGFEEQDAVFIFRPGKKPESILFVHPKNPALETWEGFLYGEKEAQKVFKVDEAYSNELLQEKLADLLQEADSVFYKMGDSIENDEIVIKSLQSVLRKKGRKGHPLQNIKDPNALVSKLRVIKTKEEIELMKKTCEISAQAHIEVIKASKPGISETELEGVFQASIMKAGAKNVAYSSIVATGDNATTLHYVFNDKTCKEGELLLIDAGSEYKYYAGDITRTFPVGQKFTEDQKRIYEKVLKVQKDLIAMVKPGCTFKALNEFCAKGLTQIMIEEGLLKGSLEELYKNGDFKKYYPHGVGHFLGIDVHDVGYYEEKREPVPFEPGMVLTIEPGIYIPLKDEEAPEHLKGIGIRIEDDVLVTAQGNEVLTASVPKEVFELEALKS